MNVPQSKNSLKRISDFIFQSISCQFLAISYMLNIPERLFIMNSVLNPDIQINVKCLVVF